jgi:hypothetical protein
MSLFAASGLVRAAHVTFSTSRTNASIVAERGEEGQRPPAAMRSFGNQPLASRRTSMAARHIGFGPGFVDEDDPGRIKPALLLLPLRPPLRHVGPILLAGMQASFLKLMPSCSKKCQTAKWLTLIPRAASSAPSAGNVMSGFSARACQKPLAFPGQRKRPPAANIVGCGAPGRTLAATTSPRSRR